MKLMGSLGRAVVSFLTLSLLSLCFAGPSLAAPWASDFPALVPALVSADVSLAADQVRHELLLEASTDGLSCGAAFEARALTHELYCGGGFVLERGANRS